MTSLEKWGIFLKYANDRDYKELLSQIKESKEEISIVSELLQSISEDPHMQARLLTIHKNETDRESFKMYEIARGKKEKALDCARVMVKDNMPKELISKYAGISSDEVDFLISRHAAHTFDQVKVFDLKFV